MMPWPDRRREWTDVRLDYYVSARNLIGLGFFHSAGILFAYAVETHLQATLYEVYEGDQVDAKVGNDTLKKHKITKLGGFKNQPQQLMFGSSFSEFHIEQQLAVNLYR